MSVAGRGVPRQNRVDPFGTLISTPARGSLMSNRGCLHDDQGRVQKTWVRVPWVTCVLSFKGRHREIMSPGQYTELFFLDEVTALAAGHRPCATCRRSEYTAFKEIWLGANRASLPSVDAGIGDVDRQLHRERLASAGRDSLWEADCSGLPDGTMVTQSPAGHDAWVKWGRRLHRWTPEGYVQPEGLAKDLRVWVITPRSIVAALEAGYRPAVHPSLEAEAGASAGNRSERCEQPIHTAVATPSSPVAGTLDQAEEAVALTEPRYRLERTPAGPRLYEYFAAILRITGMDKGAVYPLKRFFSNLSQHEKAGRIQRAAGGHQLTRAGIDYFADRFRAGNPQHVDELGVSVMLKGLQNGGPGWIPLP